MILRDINNLEQELLSAASIRELALFNYINKKDNKNINNDEKSDIDNIIVNILSGNTECLEEEIDTIVCMKNRKGIDYRKNIIILVAFGLYDLERFRVDIVSYISTCSLRDSYLLSWVFESIKPEYNKIASTPIDILIDEVLINKNYNQGIILLEKALGSVKDLFDLFIVKEAYSILGEQNFQGSETYKTMKFTIDRLNKWIGDFIIKFLLIVFWVIFIPIIKILGIIISENWDIAEPYTYIVSTIAGIALNSFILMNKSINIQTFGNRIKTNKLERIYKKNNLDFEKIMKL